MKTYLAVFIILLSGCSFSVKPSKPPELIKSIELSESCIPDHYDIKVRPIIPTINGNHFWTSDKLNKQFNYARFVYQSIGINLIFLEPKYLDDDCVSILDDEDWEYVKLICKEHTQKTHELGIWMGNVIILPGMLLGGLSCSVFDLSDNNYGIAIAAYSEEISVAHELGHQFGLLHNWEDVSPEDPDFCEKDVCDRIDCKYNLMGYCHGISDKNTLQYVFTIDQIIEIYYTLNTYPRNQLIKN